MFNNACVPPDNVIEIAVSVHNVCVCVSPEALFSALTSYFAGLDSCPWVSVCVYVHMCVCVCVHICLSVFHQCVHLLTREAPVELALCDQPSVVPVKVLVARPDADPLVLVKLLASFEKGLDASAAVVPGGATAREVLEGLCEGGDGLSVGLAIEKVRVEGWRDGMVW